MEVADDWWTGQKAKEPVERSGWLAAGGCEGRKGVRRSKFVLHVLKQSDPVRMSGAAGQLDGSVGDGGWRIVGRAKGKGQTQGSPTRITSWQVYRLKILSHTINLFACLSCQPWPISF